MTDLMSLVLQGVYDPVAEELDGLLSFSGGSSEYPGQAGADAGYRDWLMERLVEGMFGRRDVFVGTTGLSVEWPGTVLTSNTSSPENLPAVPVASPSYPFRISVSTDFPADVYEGVQVYGKSNVEGLSVVLGVVVDGEEHAIGQGVVGTDWVKLEARWTKDLGVTIEGVYMEVVSGPVAYEIQFIIGRISLLTKSVFPPPVFL